MTLPQNDRQYRAFMPELQLSIDGIPTRNESASYRHNGILQGCMTGYCREHDGFILGIRREGNNVMLGLPSVAVFN